MCLLSIKPLPDLPRHLAHLPPIPSSPPQSVYTGPPLCVSRQAANVSLVLLPCAFRVTSTCFSLLPESLEFWIIYRIFFVIRFSFMFGFLSWTISRCPRDITQLTVTLTLVTC